MAKSSAERKREERARKKLGIAKEDPASIEEKLKIKREKKTE